MIREIVPGRVNIAMLFKTVALPLCEPTRQNQALRWTRSINFSHLRHRALSIVLVRTMVLLYNRDLPFNENLSFFRVCQGSSQKQERTLKEERIASYSACTRFSRLPSVSYCSHVFSRVVRNKPKRIVSPLRCNSKA